MILRLLNKLDKSEVVAPFNSDQRWSVGDEITTPSGKFRVTGDPVESEVVDGKMKVTQFAEAIAPPVKQVVKGEKRAHERQRLNG